MFYYHTNITFYCVVWSEKTNKGVHIPLISLSVTDTTVRTGGITGGADTINESKAIPVLPDVEAPVTLNT